MKVPMSSVMNLVKVDVEITGGCSHWLRLKAGLWLMKLAAYVMGCDIRVSTN